MPHAEIFYHQKYKRMLSQHLINDAHVNSENCFCYSKICYGWKGRLITQFQLGLSPLRNDLFRYNIIDNPFCPACGDCLETLKHYLIKCTAYHAHRLILFADLLHACSLVGSDLPELNLLYDVTILEVITKGSPLALSHPQLQFVNKLVFSCVSKYIGSTGRFRTQI